MLEPDSKNFPNFTASIQEAVNQAEVIFIIVYDPPAVQSVFNQIQSELGPGQLVIQSSTISAKWTRLFAEEVQKTGARFLEAPFTGSKSRSGTAPDYLLFGRLP